MIDITSTQRDFLGYVVELIPHCGSPLDGMKLLVKNIYEVNTLLTNYHDDYLDMRVYKIFNVDWREGYVCDSSAYASGEGLPE